MKIVFISNSNYYFYVHSLSESEAPTHDFVVELLNQQQGEAIYIYISRNRLRVHCAWLIWSSSSWGAPFSCHSLGPPLSISITYFILTALFYSWLATKGTHDQLQLSSFVLAWSSVLLRDAMTSCLLVRVAGRSWWLGPSTRIETNSNMGLAKWQNGKNLPRHIYIKQERHQQLLALKAGPGEVPSHSRRICWHAHGTEIKCTVVGRWFHLNQN